MSGTYAGAEQPRSLGNRYELGAVLGRGGMAEVFMARDTRLGRAVAVKTLRADLSRDPTFQARFRREAQSAASLNHPAIVAIYDTGEDFENGVSVPYIVMEYADGSTLRDLLHSGRRLLPERALEITAGVLQALDYSHRNGIIHRDIKPANIMLTRSGTVKVMDFGIARAMADNGMTMTQTAAVIGTAQYLSPEQAKGETVDARSDLYSTGCLMYELLTGRPPFVGDSPVAVAYQHVREEPLPPSSYDPEVTPVIDAVVLKSLAKSADQRYQSAAEMRADIERALDGRPTEAQTALLGGANMPTQRIDPRVLGAAGAAGGAALASGGVQTTRQFDPIQDMPTGYQNPQPQGPPARYGDDEYGDRGRGTPPPSRRVDRRPPEPEPKGGKVGYIVLAVAGIGAVVAAVLLAKTLLKPGGASDQLAVPTLVGQNATDLTTFLAKPENGGGKFTLAGTGTDCGTSGIELTGKKGTVVAQDPQYGTYQKPSPIKYCISVGPKLGAIAPGLKGQPQAAVVAALKQAQFKTDGINVTTQANDTIPAGSVIDVIDVSTGSSILGKTGLDTASIVPGLVVSSGKQLIPLQTGNLTGVDVNTAIAQLKAQGFTNVIQGVDSSAPASPTPTTVTKISPGDGSYAANQLITVYHAPQAVATTTPPPTQCDPQTDPNQCQSAPANNPSSSAGQGTTGGGLLGGPGTSPTTTKGHG